MTKRPGNGTLVALIFASIFHVGAAAHADPGFFDPTSSAAPIGDAASAVYRYVILDEQGAHVYSRKEYLAVIQQMGTGDFVHRLIAQTVKDCLQKNLESCAIPFAGSGTAFISGAHQDRLLTVSHNLDWDKASYRKLLTTPEGHARDIWLGKDEEALMRNMPLHFALYDRSGNSVFDTRREGDFANPEVMGYGAMVNWIKGFHGETPVDFVSIRLSHAVGHRSLELRPDQALVGESLTVVGYPQRTETRRYYESAPDSDGLRQYSSTGAVYAVSNVLQFNFGPAYTADPLRDAQIGQAILYADTESVMGLSGAPLLDKGGKVAGILSEQWGMADARMYTLKSAIVIHSAWLERNLAKYSP